MKASSTTMYITVLYMLQQLAVSIEHLKSRGESECLRNRVVNKVYVAVRI